MNKAQTTSPRGLKLSHRAGFTMIEMLVGLAIIAMIAGLVGPKVINYLSDAKVKTAQIQTTNIAAALDLFYLDTGRYPTTEEGLKALVEQPKATVSWNGPYLKSNPTDPWGHEYTYHYPGQTGPYDIGTLGPDGKGGSIAGLKPSGTHH